MFQNRDASAREVPDESVKKKVYVTSYNLICFQLRQAEAKGCVSCSNRAHPQSYLGIAMGQPLPGSSCLSLVCQQRKHWKSK